LFEIADSAKMFYENNFLSQNCINDQFANLIELDESKIAIYPNPCSDLIFVKNNSKSDLIKILDLTGKLLINTNSNLLDVSQLNSGTYIISIENHKIKFVKE
jgi:hypothetical protein